jgi:K+-transporting ATPase KdpF subunit
LHPQGLGSRRTSGAGLCPQRRAKEGPHWRVDKKEFPMPLDFILGGITVAGLLVYLVYALIRPERF